MTTLVRCSIGTSIANTILVIFTCSSNEELKWVFLFWSISSLLKNDAMFCDIVISNKMLMC